MMYTKKVVFPTRHEWAEALRSGEYVQGKSSLRNRDNNLGVDEYCCLGVYADLFIKANPKTATHWDTDSESVVDRFVDARGEYHVGILGIEMAEEIGLDMNQQQALVDMNDEFELTFDEIAEHIDNEDYILSPKRQQL